MSTLRKQLINMRLFANVPLAVCVDVWICIGLHFVIEKVCVESVFMQVRVCVCVRVCVYDG